MMSAKKLLVRVVQSLGVMAAIWVVAWLIGGVSFAMGALVIITLFGIIGVFVT